MLASKQIVIQGCAHTADMQRSRRARNQNELLLFFLTLLFLYKIRRKINLNFPIFRILRAKKYTIMRSFKTNKRFSYKNLIYKSLIFIATVSGNSLLFTNEGKFNYQFDINKPWKYGLLQASFDFPIYKTTYKYKRNRTASWQTINLISK